MCSKSRNEDKDNIDQDIDVCAMGVQTIMQSDHGMPRNQNKLKILGMIFIPSVWDSSRIAVEILKFDQKKEKSLTRKYVLTIALWSKWQLYYTKVIGWKMRIFVLLPSFQRRKLRVEAWGIWKQKYNYFVRCDTDESGMNYFIQSMIPSYATHTESFFYATVFGQSSSICYNCDFYLPSER